MRLMGIPHENLTTAIQLRVSFQLKETPTDKHIHMQTAILPAIA